MTKIKPCPRCGHTEVITLDLMCGYPEHQWCSPPEIVLECENCWFDVGEPSETQEKAIEKWNNYEQTT